MNLTIKEFRHLAQSVHAVAMAGAVVAGVALAWYVFHTYRHAQDAKINKVTAEQA